MSIVIRIEKTTTDNPDFHTLIAALDHDLWERYPAEGAEYWENNILEFNPNVLVVYLNDVAVACACFKKYEGSIMELKRMFVAPKARGLGLAQQLLFELEVWAAESGYDTAILETLHLQKEAIALYQKMGYEIIDNYPPYVGLPDSVCMQKQL